MILRLALLSLALAPAAGAFELELPVDCTSGETCFVQNYFDHDPTAAVADPFCGPLTYDGHDGTDIAIPTLADMAAGVTVRAAAAGTVRATRDGLPDNARFPAGQDCGNGLAITHPDGWETQYCHLKQGSILVTQGQTVAAGDPLGQIGLSGNTEFPHLHLSVRKGGAELDPFAPDATATCGTAGPDLWQPDIAYLAGGIAGIGLSPAIPAFDAIKAGTTAPVTPASPAMVVWAHIFGARQGDEITLSITGPQGGVIADTVMIDRTQARSFRAIGKKARGAWPAGGYSATALLMRGGVELDRATLTVTLP